MPKLELRLGVDVGRTHTDAVVLDRDSELVAKVKVPTSPDIAGGIGGAVRRILRNGAVDPSRISHVMVGTTHATNAILKRQGLGRVAVVRIGGPSTRAVRPLFGWPPLLHEAVSAGECIVDGGAEVDGRPAAQLDEKELARFFASLSPSVDRVAITSVFAGANPAHEIAAKDVARCVLGSDVHVSMSHEIGTQGLLERENTTVLNAALVGTLGQVTHALGRALKNASVYFTRNDGTLMTVEYAMHFPVLTIGSGPANSIRGAAHLAGINDALVVDVGGSSTDIGMLSNGFPREWMLGANIGGIDTNFHMPDVTTVPIGGGTVVAPNGLEVNGARLGPESVGHQLSSRALDFEGTASTLSAAAAVGGRSGVGHAEHTLAVAPLLRAALATFDRMISEGIDSVRTSREELPLIAVGGGSALVPEDLPGICKVIRPANGDVANAIGAATATVSGHVDKIVNLSRSPRSDLLDRIRTEACRNAIRAGADAREVRIVAVEETPLTYMGDSAVRVRAKALGPLHTD